MTFEHRHENKSCSACLTTLLVTSPVETNRNWYKLKGLENKIKMKALEADLIKTGHILARGWKTPTNKSLCWVWVKLA